MTRKHKITVTLYWKSIESDVQNKAYRMARLAKLGVTDAAAADRLESEITLTEDDMVLLRRAMAQGLAEVVTMCGEYVWSTSHLSYNFTVKASNITLILMMPVNFNLAGCESLGQMIHAYIVGKAMTEWFRYTVPSRVAEQESLCAAARAEIMKIIHARVRMARGAQQVEVIVGDVKQPLAEMLYCTDPDVEISTVPTEETHTIRSTWERSATITANEDNPQYVAVALPLGYTPNIGGEPTRQIGKAEHEGMEYVWWIATTGRFYDAVTITY